MGLLDRLRALFTPVPPVPGDRRRQREEDVEEEEIEELVAIDII